MPLILETGAGLSNSNSYVEIADVDAYIVAHNLQAEPEAIAWAALSASEQEDSALSASRVTDNLERFPYSGSKAAYVNAMQWPRSGGEELYGVPIPTLTVPHQVKSATCEYALIDATGTDINPIASEFNDTVKKEEMEELKLEYFSATERGIATGATYPNFAPDRLLFPLLRDLVEEASTAAQAVVPGTLTPTPSPAPMFWRGQLDGVEQPT